MDDVQEVTGNTLFGSPTHEELSKAAYRCWQERIPNDELRYLKSLQKSRSPLRQYLVPQTTQPA